MAKDSRLVIRTGFSSEALLTLGSGTVLKEAVPIACLEDWRLIKVEGVIGVEGLTGEEGPIVVGIADDSLSVGEIGEALAASGPNNTDSAERSTSGAQAKRPVWIIDVLGSGAAGSIPKAKPFSKKIMWTFADGFPPNFFAFNMGSAALTTGTLLRVLQKQFGVWVV